MANIIKPRSRLIVRYPAGHDNIIYAGSEYIIPFEFDEIGLSNPSQLNVYVSYKKASTGDEVELQYTTDTKDYVIEAFVGDAFNQSINADLDNYGYLRMTRTITDVECLYIYRKTEVSQLKDFNTNSYSMASIGEAINKLTMILQEQGGLTPAIRIPETVMIENNISAPIKYNSYVPNCLLGTKDNPSEIVPYYPDGVTLTFNKGIVTDEEGNEQEVNNGFLSSHVCVYKIDHDNDALFFIPASLCRVIPNKGIEVLQQINILPGNAMSMSLEGGITPPGGTPSDGTSDDDDAPAPQSMKFLKIDGADVEAKDNYIIVTNSRDGNGNITAWNVGVNLPELERLINNHIPSGEPVDNSPIVPVPSEVIVKSMPTYDVDRDADVIGIKKYTGSATLQGINPTYLAVTSACELLLGISEENSVRLQWDKISIIPPAYDGETQPQVGAFSYSEATGNLLIVCSNVNYIFGVHIGSTFETLTYTIFDTTTYCPSPYGANGGECCAWSGSSSAFFVAPSNDEVTGNLLIISADQNGMFSIGTDSDFDRSQVPGSFDYVKCDLLRSSTTSQNCSDVLLCMTSNGYVYRKRYVEPSTFVHNFYIPTLAELSDVSALEVLGRVPVFSPNVESEIWQQIILFRYKETGNNEWIYKQTVFYNKTRNYTRDLYEYVEYDQKPSRLIGECVRARGGTYGEGQVYTQDGKCWWYRPHVTPTSPTSSLLYIDFFCSDGSYDTTNITGANSIRDVIDKEYAVDNTRYWAFNATNNNWVQYVFFTDRYQYQIVRSLYTFDGYLSALANVTVDNTLLQFFMWTQDGGENWSFKTVNDGTDNEYIDCIYSSDGVLFIPKEWNTNIRYAVLRTLNSEVEKKTINDDYGYTFGGFVIQNDNKLKYCILYSEEESQIDGELLLLTTNDISDPLTWEQDVSFGSSDGTEFETPIEQIKKKTYFSTGILPYSNPTLYSNAVVIVPKDLGNGFILWLDKGTSSLFNVIFDEDEFVMPIGGATFDEQGFALLVNKYNNASNLYQQSQIYYYLSPNDNSGYISEAVIINNLKVYDIPSVQSYKPERLIYNRLTSLWTLFYKKQTASSSEQEALIIYTASNLEELVSGTPKFLSGTQDIELDMLIQNQYGFFSFGNGKAMLSATPKTVFNLLDNYFNLLDNYVQKTTTINNKALSSNVTLTASDVGALPSDGTATKAISDQYGQNIANTYVTQQSILQMLSPNLETTSGTVRVYSEIINSLNKKIRELCTQAGISTDGLPPVYTSSL